MKLNGTRKGQILSTEIILALSLFMGSIVVFILAWGYISSSYFSEQADRQMQVALIGISDAAVLTPGDPADWETNARENASSFGFASSRNIISAQKLSALQSLNTSYYDRVRERMGAGRFELYLEVRDTAGNSLYRFGKQAGISTNSTAALSIDRLALLNDSLATLRIQLWRNKR